MKKIIALGTVTVLTIVLAGCTWFQQSQTDEVVYKNSEYGFSLVLPAKVRGFKTSIDDDPIPPETFKTIDFSHEFNAFLSVGIFTLDGWQEYGHPEEEIGRTEEYIFNAWHTTPGLPVGYIISEEEFEKVKNSFKLVE